MPTPEGPQTPKVSPSLGGLSDAAATLNHASRRLTNAVETLDDALQKLNLGIDAWVDTWSKAEDPNQVCEYEQIGYAKIKGSWGIGIRLTLENLGNRPDPEVREWQFREAPRDMRMRNAKYLHKLIERINEEAAAKAREIDENADETEKLAEVIVAAAEASKARVKAVLKGGK